MVRQIAELLQLPSDFDAICPQACFLQERAGRGLVRRGATRHFELPRQAAEVRAALLRVAGVAGRP